ncbi:phosphate ABC transporter substrate-binding protein [Alkaliphilus peptidifermentans]|uniref:Phosphate ABC transporter substrate-binding protein, PhoT family (TC 3.A.1.7.1) n=1 Tax=Alkaliphilus peptidifermentans DSM 18978 TaxID=1120976 RepID=A0A1G5CEP1_9FIRM|nr:phosphate ABC transporter substrate-binding protein [Alkaliphilus peptidifermentans]SCY00791.1 phosphate ABC transporter substrate-binding protein, PhoT family (TC 3.A.1.7.1) [Alkaliphilus peptidifermentans DSM 18978]
MKKINLLICLFLVFSLMLTGCNKADTTSGNDDFKAEIMFSGSSTLAPVISKAAEEFKELHKTWDNVDKSFPNEEISIFVSSGGSGAGIKAAIEETADFGLTARAVKSDEKEALGEHQEYTLGVDALTISLNPENPILEFKDNFTSEELQKIFSGEYTHWNEVDDRLPNTEIVVVIRDIGGGAHEVFQSSIMKDIDVRQDAIQSPSMGALVTKIIENKGAIGYASFGAVNINEGKIIPLKVDDVEPTIENILNGSYKISRPLIVVKKGEPTEAEQKFIDFLFSTKGVEIIEELGFVPSN